METGQHHLGGSSILEAKDRNQLIVFTVILVALTVFAFITLNKGLLYGSVALAFFVQVGLLGSVVDARNKKQCSRGLVSIFMILIIASFTFNVVMVVTYSERRINKAAPGLVKHVSDYIKVKGFKEGEWDNTRSQKLLLINVDKKAIDDLDPALPETNRAKTAKDVQTVVWLKYDDVAVWTYTDGRSGFQTECTVSVVDMKNKTLYRDVNTIKGPEPRKTKTWTALDVHAGQPTKEVVDYLLAIPVEGGSGSK